MPRTFVAPVELLGVPPVETLNSFREVAFGRFHEQMNMICHEAVSETAPIKSPRDVNQKVQVETSIQVVAIDVIAGNPSRVDVVDGSRSVFS